MLGFIKRALENIGGFFKSFLLWFYEHLVPESVKQKLSSIGAELSGATFVEYVFYVLKIFTYWYFYVVMISIIVVYRLFAALEKAGILAKFEDLVTNILKSVLYISSKCFPQIGSGLNAVMQCISTSPSF